MGRSSSVLDSGTSFRRVGSSVLDDSLVVKTAVGSGSTFGRRASVLDAGSAVHRIGEPRFDSTLGESAVVKKVVTSGFGGRSALTKIIGSGRSVGRVDDVLVGGVSGRSVGGVSGRSAGVVDDLLVGGRNRLGESHVVLKPGRLSDSPVVFRDGDGFEGRAVVKSVGSNIVSRGLLDSELRGNVGTGRIGVVDVNTRSGLGGVSGVIRGSDSGCRKSCLSDADCFGDKVCVAVGCNMVCRRSESNGYSK